MRTVVLLTAAGREFPVAFDEGESLMRAALRAGVDDIVAECGGTLTCGTCHVYVEEAWWARLPRPSEAEDGMLNFTAADRRPTSRLSCQIRLTAAMNGLRCELPASQV